MSKKHKEKDEKHMKNFSSKMDKESKRLRKKDKK